MFKLLTVYIHTKATELATLKFSRVHIISHSQQVLHILQDMYTVQTFRLLF